MSVPVYKRNQSKVEFINNFNKLRKEIIILLMRDFGIKARTYTVHLLEDIYDLSEEDKKIFEELSDKYDINSYDIDKYPEWLINGWRNEILMILNNIGIEMQCANCIYVTNIQEYYARRNHWNNAIGYCMALMDKLHEVISCVKVGLGAYTIIFDMITRQINLIKGVRKSDNKLLNKFNDQLPYFNNGFVYNNYPYMPFVPSYTTNSNSVGPVRKIEMCVIVENNKLDKVA